VASNSVGDGIGEQRSKMKSLTRRWGWWALAKCLGSAGAVLLHLLQLPPTFS
jgi:hypothetical protein